MSKFCVVLYSQAPDPNNPLGWLVTVLCTTGPRWGVLETCVGINGGAAARDLTNGILTFPSGLQVAPLINWHADESSARRAYAEATGAEMDAEQKGMRR